MQNFHKIPLVDGLVVQHLLPGSIVPVVGEQLLRLLVNMPGHQNNKIVDEKK